MAARKRTLWGDVKFIVLAVIFLLIAVPCSFAAYRLIWTDATLCLAEGKVLSDEEHRQRFLESLVRRGVDNAYIYKEHDGNTHLKAGIIYDGKSYDLIRTVRSSKGNGKSFEENFGIKKIAPVSGKSEFEYPHEPFVLVTYFDAQSGSSTFVSSQDVVVLKDWRGLREKIGLYDRFRGFGTKFYEVTFSMLSVECCGNNRYSQTEEMYSDRKEFFYKDAMSSIEKGSMTRTAVAASSNCGEVLTGEGDNGIATRIITWITVRDKR